MTQCQITVITLTLHKRPHHGWWAVQKCLLWVVSLILNSARAARNKNKKHAGKYVDCCQEKKLTMSII